MKTAEDIVNANNRGMVSIDGDKKIFDAVRLMAENRIGTVLIEGEDRMVGIFSERDLLRISADPNFDLKTARVRDYMSSPLRSATYDTPVLKLKEMFLGLFIRHIVIEKEGKQIGLLSIGDVMRASLLAQDKKMKELNTLASWEYYDNWGWDHKR